MPTDVTPAPFKYSQQFPIALEHPHIHAKMFSGDAGQRLTCMGRHQYNPHQQHAQYAEQYSQSPHHHLPIPERPQQYPQQVYRQSSSHSHHPIPFLGHPSLPRLAPLSLPIYSFIQDSAPNKCLPNGVRNPYSPYAGEAYVPSSEKANRMALDQTGSPLQPVSSLRSLHPAAHGAESHAGSLPIPIPVPRGGFPMSGWAAGAAMSHSMSHQDGRRIDDGWDGSQGRAHMGHMPDPTSTAGRLNRTPDGIGITLGLNTLGGSISAWSQVPSSWQNHASMTPSMVPPPVTSPALVVKGAPGLLRSHTSTATGEFTRDGSGRPGLESGSAEDKLRSRRTSFVVPGEACRECTCSPVLGRSASVGDPQSAGSKERRESRFPVHGQAQIRIVNSPLMRIAKLSIDDNVGSKRERRKSVRYSPDRNENSANFRG